MKTENMKTEDQKTLDLVTQWNDAIVRTDPSPNSLIWAVSTMYSIIEKTVGEEGKRELAIQFATAVEAARKL
jgi:hypothetical protein